MASTQQQEKESPELQEARPPEGGEQQKKGTGRGAAVGKQAARYLAMPLFLVAVCVALYLWVGSYDLDSIEQRTLNREFILQRVVQHLEITGIATLIVVTLAITTGVVLTRGAMRRVAPTIVGIASVGQAIPSIGVIVLIAVYLSEFGPRIAILALVIYAFLPVLRNTMVGIQQVDSSVIEAGRGMGMTKSAVLFRIELPLAIPIMLAGIRTALIIVVGTAALATFINAGGMGDMINNGIKLSRTPVLVTGSVLTAVLALSIDYVAGVAEDILRPKGL